MYIIIRVIQLFFNVIIFALLARAILSWFINPYRRVHPALAMINRIAYTLTEPIVNPVRRLTSKLKFGVIDISLMVTCFLLYAVESLLIKIIIVIFTGRII